MIISELNKNIRLTLVADSDVQKNHFCPTTVGELESCGYLTVDGSIPGNFELHLPVYHCLCAMIEEKLF